MNDMNAISFSLAELLFVWNQVNISFDGINRYVVKKTQIQLKSLAPETGYNFTNAFAKRILGIHILSTSCEIGLLISIGSDNDLVSWDNRPLSSPILNQNIFFIWRQ